MVLLMVLMIGSDVAAYKQRELCVHEVR